MPIGGTSRARQRRHLPAGSSEALDLLRALLLRAEALRGGSATRARPPETNGRRPRKKSYAHRDSTFEVKVLERENQLRTTLRGFIDAERAEALLAQVERVLPRLRPGFDVISDVSGLGTVTAAAHPMLRRAAAELVEAGMRQMVRVVGASGGAAADVARVTEGLYEARVVPSMAAAMRVLSELSSTRTANPRSPPDPPTEHQTGELRRAAGPGHTARTGR
jgi:hypothetical protein